MNIAQEFLKVKSSFLKVKEEMTKINSRMHENYEHFLKEHYELSKKVDVLSNQLTKTITEFKTNHIGVEGLPQSVIAEVKTEIKEIKKYISESAQVHGDMNLVLEKIKKNELSISQLKEKLSSNELEIYLLKERLIEKDAEIKHMKEINSHMLKVLDELSALEIEILNKTK